MTSIGKVSTLCLMIILIIFTFSCKKDQEAENDSFRIVTTIYPYYLIISELVGPQADVHLLIPANSSPHLFSPTPLDIRKLENADLIIANGGGLESRLGDKLSELKDRVHFMFDILSEDNLLDIADEDHGMESDHNHEDQHHEAHDPHIWLDTINLKIILNNITKQLSKYNPEQSQNYQETANLIEKRLTDLNRSILNQRKQMADSIGIITYHNAFGYFCRRYEIEVVGTVTGAPGKTPTPRDLKKLADLIRKENVSAIFVEPELNPQGAQIIADEFDLKLLTLDPIGFYSKAEKIDDIITYNWQQLTSVLPPERLD